MIKIRNFSVISIVFNIIFNFSLICQNIIPNPSFESYYKCPDDWNQCENASGWKKAYENTDSRFTTEYLNSCGTAGFQVPYNVWGYQYAASGNAYMATATFSSSIKTDYRENMFAQLTTQVNQGEKLFLSLKVCLANKSMYASNNFGLKFSTSTSFPIDNKCELYSASIITDSVNWTQISGIITASADYKYVAFGNFIQDLNTSKTLTNSNVSGGHCVYYVDDLLAIKLGFIFNNLCLGDITSFKPTNSNYLDSVIWDFGDYINPTANISRNLNSSHKYSSSGTYRVKLTIFIKGYSTVIEKDLTIFNKPKAIFYINDSIQCLQSNSFVFINTSISSYGMLHYDWNLGDNSFSTEKHPRHSYISSGKYNIKLVCTDQGGCKDSNIKNVIVLPQTISDFEIIALNKCLDSNKFIFNNTTTNNFEYFSSYWDFGDNTIDTNFNTVHHYSKEGIYVVKLITTALMGCKDTTYKFLNVYSNPEIDFTVNDTNQCFNDNKFIFTFVSLDDDLNCKKIWDFGDKTIDTSKITIHSYNQPGSYLVTLLVKSSEGCYQTIGKLIEVYNNPKANFIVNDTIQCLDSNLFIFTNLSTSKNCDLNNLWNFGDNQFDTTSIPKHTYLSPGIYNVTLIVKDIFFCSDTINHFVYIDSSPVILNICSNTPVCENEKIDLCAKSNSLCHYYWSGPNGFKSNFQSPSIEFAKIEHAGMYTLTLKSGNCISKSDSIIVVVNKLPRFFLGNDTFLCYNSIIINPNQEGKFEWSDGTSTEYFEVLKPGSYSLVITDSNNCKYTDTIYVSWHCPASIYIPNAFTPNEDGLNDVFQILCENISNFKIEIFNRWGEIVFISTDFNTSWDGYFKNDLCQMGYYYYNIFYSEGDSKNIKFLFGTVLLLR